MMPEEETMSAQEMLTEVQRLKELGVMALFGQLDSNTALAEINGFMHAHRMQILDMLDDALYAHLTGGKI